MFREIYLTESTTRTLRDRYERVRERMEECALRDFDALSDEERKLYSLILINDDVLPFQP
jgi:hypothetical protein